MIVGHLITGVRKGCSRRRRKKVLKGGFSEGFQRLWGIVP